MFATLQASGSNLLEITGTSKPSQKDQRMGRVRLASSSIWDPAIADKMKSSSEISALPSAAVKAIIANLENFSERLRRSDACQPAYHRHNRFSG